MAALTTDDIEGALMLHVAGGLCKEASGQDFNPRACAEAAKAFKHAAFARLIEQRREAAAALANRVNRALAAAEASLKAHPTAGQLVSRLRADVRPALTTFPTSSKTKPTLTIGKAKIASRHAPVIHAVWTLKFEVGALVADVASALPASSDHSVVAHAIASAWSVSIKPAAHRLKLALAAAEACGTDAAPPAKRPRTDPGPAPDG